MDHRIQTAVDPSEPPSGTPLQPLQACSRLAPEREDPTQTIPCSASEKITRRTSDRTSEHSNRNSAPLHSSAYSMPLHDKQTKKKERQQKNRYPGKRPQAAVLTPYRYTPSVTTLHTSCLGLFRELLSLSLFLCGPGRSCVHCAAIPAARRPQAPRASPR